MKASKSSGHPVKQDKDIAKLYKALEASVELVRDLEGRLSPKAHGHLVGASLGMMAAYFELTGKPDPIQLIQNDDEVIF